MLELLKSSQKYSFVVNLVRKSTPEELSERVKNGKIISKERVIQESKWLGFLKLLIANVDQW